MAGEWYPQNKEELNKILDYFLSQKVKEKAKDIHGVIVPHAGFAYSGEIAGKAYSLLKDKIKKQKIKRAIIFGPSHYVGFKGIASLNQLKTPLGSIEIPKNFYQKLVYEHSIENQVPFLQKLGIKEILPIVVGEINEKEAVEIAKQFSNEDLFIFSTDLSHFLSYEKAKDKDKKTIELIQSLNLKKSKEIDACGIFPLMIAMSLCKLKSWKINEIEYKNSGDITGDKGSVVGYSSLYF